MEAFKLEALSFFYPERTVPALSDISLTVGKGEFFVVCGHSGCGKSTLLRCLKPAASPHGKRLGNIYFFGRPTDSLPEREAAAKIGFVMQSPDSQTVTDKVWHELAFGLESLGLEDGIIRRRSAEMAAFFGIEEWYYKNVSELSGGQKQLLGLASVMAMQPEVLILDEPTAQLDPIAASEFLAVLGRINRELGTTVILSEHRLEEALALASRAAVMENGRLLCCGTPREIGEFLRSENSEMFSAMPSAMRIWGSVESKLPCPITVNEGKAFAEEYMRGRSPAALRPKKKELKRGKIMLCASEAWFRYERNTPDVVKELTLSARAGEMLCILGGNGSGKTTSLRLLAGLKKPYRGEITRGGRIGFLPQNPQTVFIKKTVREDLKDALKRNIGSAKNENGEIEKIAALCRLSGLLDRHPYDLSGGEQQRAALAKILLLSPEILLLDEPTKGLDAPFKEILAEILQTLKNSGVCIVTVSHDIEFCSKYADRCGLFFDGRLITEGSPREFFAGNSFYTTSANRIAREIEPRAITAEDVIAVIGGKCEERRITDRTAALPERAEGRPEKTAKMPLWRKAGAALSGISAAAMLIYAAKNENLRDMTDGYSLTSEGMLQLAFYGVFILLMLLTAFFIGMRQNGSAPVQTPSERRKIPKRTAAACVMILLFIPVTLFIGVFYLDKKQYYLTSLAVLIECMLPFFLVFEGRRPKARELVTVATLCALAVAGRAAFFMLPQFKPVMALTVISGVALGGETGFLVGAVSMLVSNIMFSQGPWTPWQMFAMGIIGFLAGLLYRKGLLMRSRLSLSIFGAVCAILIYGGIMNPAAALIWGGESLNFSIILSYYATGFPLDAVHAAATALFLWFGAEPMLEKLDRIKTKYGLCEP